MHTPSLHAAFRRRAAWISLGWAGIGLVLLLTSPLPCWTERLGWSPLFWLMVAPLSVLTALRMSRPAPSAAVAGPALAARRRIAAGPG